MKKAFYIVGGCVSLGTLIRLINMLSFFCLAPCRESMEKLLDSIQKAFEGQFFQSVHVIWNTNPTKNVPFVGFPVTIYFQCFWVWYCSLTLVLPLFGKESRFMQILYLVMTYTHTNHDEVPSGVCCDSFVLILMHFGLRSICCSRRWMWQVWAWLVIEAQKDCLRFLGATYKHIVILCTPVHSNLHTNILYISQVYDKPPKAGCWPPALLRRFGVFWRRTAPLGHWEWPKK